MHVRTGARTSDLSTTGCYVDTLNPLPCGTDVELRITHKDETVTVSGTVAYARANLGMGVQFDPLTDHQLRVFRTWIDELL